MGLSKLYELEFQGGRATSAPITRETTSTRSTMAEIHSMTSGNNDNCNTTTYNTTTLPAAP